MTEIFKYTKTVIDDINSAKLEESDPIKHYLVKILIITFSSEMERHLKEIFKGSLKENPNIIDEFDDLKKLFEIYGRLSNPQFKYITKFCKKVHSYERLHTTVEDYEITQYNNIIGERNNIAHKPQHPNNITLNEVEKSLDIAEKIIAEILTIK